MKVLYIWFVDLVLLAAPWGSVKTKKEESLCCFEFLGLSCNIQKYLKAHGTFLQRVGRRCRPLVVKYITKLTDVLFYLKLT